METFARLVTALALSVLAAAAGCEEDDGAPHQPHGTITGTPVCLECHTKGATSSAPKVSGSHAGRTNDSCMGCHGP